MASKLAGSKTGAKSDFVINIVKNAATDLKEAMEAVDAAEISGFEKNVVESVRNAVNVLEQWQSCKVVAKAALNPITNTNDPLIQAAKGL